MWRGAALSAVPALESPGGHAVAATTHDLASRVRSARRGCVGVGAGVPGSHRSWRDFPDYARSVLSLGQEILKRVAAFYRPADKDPLLAVQVPLLFRAIEETARDLAAVTADLPLAHRIT